MGPEEARATKGNISVLVLAKPVAPYISYGATLREATFKDPSEFFGEMYYVDVDLVEFWIYNKRSGDIITKIKSLNPQQGKVVFGVSFGEVTPFIASQIHRENIKAVIIAVVNSNSAADKAGIKVGDVVYEFDNKPIEKTVDLQKAVAETNAGKKVSVKLLRGDKELNLDVQF
jgi:membrane-associated protease RseP (regulator of RpoE activity)